MEIRLTLKIKDVEVELNQAETKELYEMLRGLVGEKIIHEYWPRLYCSTKEYTWNGNSDISARFLVSS